MKNDISRHKDFVSGEIIKTIALLTMMVPKENTAMCTRIKFVRRSEVGCVTQATEDPKMRISWRGSMQEFIWRFIRK